MVKNHHISTKSVVMTNISARKQKHVFGDAKMHHQTKQRSAQSPPSGAAANVALLAEKRAWLFERSEFPSPPPKARTDAEILRPWGRLSLPTFFGEAKKVGGRAAVKRNLEETHNFYHRENLKNH